MRIEPRATTELPNDGFILDADSDRAWAEGYLRPALGAPPERIITRP
jgi:hypothetical protein